MMTSYSSLNERLSLIQSLTMAKTGRHSAARFKDFWRIDLCQLYPRMRTLDRLTGDGECVHGNGDAERLRPLFSAPERARRQRKNRQLQLWWLGDVSRRERVTFLRP